MCSKWVGGNTYTLTRIKYLIKIFRHVSLPFFILQVIKPIYSKKWVYKYQLTKLDILFQFCKLSHTPIHPCIVKLGSQISSH
jgi:hypothetical protein